MKIIDLFSGLGGLTIGAFEAAKKLNLPFEIVLASDIEPSCANFYKHNFKEHLHHFHLGDICDLDVAKLAKQKVDFLFAGPPCQGHSNLNNSTRRSDPRNALYLETLKVIECVEPDVFVIENVPSVVHAKEKVVEELTQKLGHKYHINEHVIDFERLGIPQTRKRHILLGSKTEYKHSLMETIYDGKVNKNLNETIGDLVNLNNPNSLFDTASRMTQVNKKRAKYLYDNNLYDLPNNLRPKCHQKNHSYKSMYGRLSWDKPAQTITGGFGSMGQGRFLHPSKLRVITPHEAARIQGIPDWLDFTVVLNRGQIQKMIGNAVPPVLSKEITKIFIKGF